MFVRLFQTVVPSSCRASGTQDCGGMHTWAGPCAMCRHHSPDGLSHHYLAAAHDVYALGQCRHDDASRLHHSRSDLHSVETVDVCLSVSDAVVRHSVYAGDHNTYRYLVGHQLVGQLRHEV